MARSYGRKKYGYKKKYRKTYRKAGKALSYNKSKAVPSAKFVKLVAQALKKTPAESTEEFKAKNVKLFNTKGGYFKWMPTRKADALVSQMGTPWQYAATASGQQEYGPWGPEAYTYDDEDETME